MNIELNRLFDNFNTVFFDGKLPKVVLSILTNGNNRRTMGWFTYGKVWKDEIEKSFYHEIAISAEYLYRGYDEICATLIHEMVHLYCYTNGIKETSRNGTYHNKKFKVEAELRGLTIGYDKRIGHSPTTLQEETKKYIESIRNHDVFELTRLNHKTKNDGNSDEPEDNEDEDFELPKKKGHHRKYECSSCGSNVRATKKVNIICGDCMVQMVCLDDDNEDDEE